MSLRLEKCMGTRTSAGAAVVAMGVEAEGAEDDTDG
jgi:hypothetical protein